MGVLRGRIAARAARCRGGCSPAHGENLRSAVNVVRCATPWPRGRLAQGAWRQREGGEGFPSDVPARCSRAPEGRGPRP